MNFPPILKLTPQATDNHGSGYTGCFILSWEHLIEYEVEKMWTKYILEQYFNQPIRSKWKKKVLHFHIYNFWHSRQPKNFISKMFKIKKWIMKSHSNNGDPEGQKLFLSNLFDKVMCYSFLRLCTFLNTRKYITCYKMMLMI